MAILFSKVTMRDDYNESEFFVSGFPQEPDDLDGWTAYHEFLDEITEDTIVNIHAVAYLYGEGETVKATPEEVTQRSRATVRKRSPLLPIAHGALHIKQKKRANPIGLTL